MRVSKLSEPIIVSGNTKICTMPALSNTGGEINDRAETIAANTQRIVSCVNAMEGIYDPAEFRKVFGEMKEALQEAVRHVDRNCAVVPSNWIEALSKAEKI